MALNEVHVTVLGKETVSMLAPESSGIYVDATLGLGGHSELVLMESGPGGRVIGFEWDQEAAILARERLARFGSRFTLVQASYARLVDELHRLGVNQVDGVIADLGVSSLQLDSQARGFSFRAEAPLDMRMDMRIESDAAELVARLSEEELADVLYYYGEERQARRIARFIVERRGNQAIATTGQLAELISEAVPRKYHPKRIHVATKSFQALRIAVNGELDNVRTLLRDAPKVLAPGGRLCIISFHSLEDRMVKQGLAADPAYDVVTRRPIQPSEQEIAGNARARSARLRVAKRSGSASPEA